MDSSYYKQTYPEIWKEIYTATTKDLIQCMSPVHVNLYMNGHKDNIIDKIAEKAAINACKIVDINKKK